MDGEQRLVRHYRATLAFSADPDQEDFPFDQTLEAIILGGITIEVTTAVATSPAFSAVIVDREYSAEDSDGGVEIFTDIQPVANATGRKVSWFPESLDQVVVSKNEKVVIRARGFNGGKAKVFVRGFPAKVENAS